VAFGLIPTEVELPEETLKPISKTPPATPSAEESVWFTGVSPDPPVPFVKSYFNKSAAFAFDTVKATASKNPNTFPIIHPSLVCIGTDPKNIFTWLFCKRNSARFRMNLTCFVIHVNQPALFSLKKSDY
jgi:hypothetical protein